MSSCECNDKVSCVLHFRDKLCCAHLFHMSNAAFARSVAVLILFRNGLRYWGLPKMVICRWQSFWLAPRQTWMRRMWVDWSALYVSMGFATDSVSETAQFCLLVRFMCMFWHNALVLNAAVGAGCLWFAGCCWHQNVSDQEQKQSWLSVRKVTFASGDASQEQLWP